MNKIFSENYVASISVLWIVIMACLVIIKRSTLDTLGLNEIGDALAGAFAPLGFFWLVAGFYQQGKGLEQNSHALNLQAQELQASTDALNLQVQEMKASVEQQKIMADYQRLEIEERHSAVFPFLEIDVGINYTNQGNNFSFAITNISDNDARNIVLRTNITDCLSRSMGSFSVVFKNSNMTFNDSFTESESAMYDQMTPFERVIYLSYESILGREFHEEYKLEVGRLINSTNRRITKIR